MMKFEYRDSRLLRFRDFFGNSSAFILLAGLTVAALWLLVAPAILGSSTEAPGSVIAADSDVITSGVIDDLLPGMRLIDDFQVSQPRDPFRPLITEDTGDTGDGGGDGFDPTGTAVSLISVTTLADDSRQAVVRVAGTDYTVGVGETFAGSYQVVTLTDTGGTFLFGDSPFALAVGEEILK
ncbi:MAG: hypothetical protein HKO63_07140 [Acidimicrobiia bacterium]|nr:hypothetical protein [Acidimicrobiia bacterium]MBT8192219.1 hypothetical protein [Acidimicrobiia bacterium]MBT8246415.1 hypothetical protein [Acidimicrobiia bacterium]NNF88580.1 hypothetical protein [Acidimicrobiia bacterium]NNJ48376.1 hypothetical protein [Acidimicrobiia bacterium]